MRSKIDRKKAFTFIELMVSLLLLSAMMLGFSTYIKKNESHLKLADISQNVRQGSNVAENLLKRDLQQVVYINPSCIDNAPTGVTVTAQCSNIKIRGGLTPYPGYLKSDMAALTDFSLPGTLTANYQELPYDSDAIRIALFNFSDGFNCPLDSSVSDNPSTISDNLWATSECSGLLSSGKLYILVEAFDDQVYANIFQVTSLTESTNVHITAQSGSSLFNQTDSLGTSGFDSNARIYPVKLVEYADDPSQGLMRREITPGPNDLNGYQNWIVAEGDVESIQFSPVTILSTGAKTHNRTMDFTSDNDNNGVEDIRGVSPHYVVKSATASTEGQTFDNPLTAVIENDHFPRYENEFFVLMRNAN